MKYKNRKNIVIVGASGHGAVVLDCIEKEGRYNVVGFIDTYKKKGTKLNGYTILGSEYDLLYLMEKYQFSSGIVAIGDNWVRKITVDRLLNIMPNFDFIKVLHPTASVGKNVTIGKGTVLMPGAVVNSNSSIGDFCILNTNASLGHDGTIDDFSSFAPKVCTGGNLSLGKYSTICLGANVIDNITIGQHTVIGSGALVLGKIGSNVLVYGAPAKEIRKREIGEPYMSGGKKASSVISLVSGD